MTEPLLVLAGIGVGVCSSGIASVCDPLALARLPQATSAPIIGGVGMRQIPSTLESVGMRLVAGGVALQREAEMLPGSARKNAPAENMQAGTRNSKQRRRTIITWRCNLVCWYPRAGPGIWPGSPIRWTPTKR